MPYYTGMHIWLWANDIYLALAGHAAVARLAASAMALPALDQGRRGADIEAGQRGSCVASPDEVNLFNIFQISVVGLNKHNNPGIPYEQYG